MTLTKTDYLAFRDRFAPSTVKLIVIAESPPKNQTYLYNPAGRTSEWLFTALMRQLGHMPTTKEDGLRELQRRGWILVDATYEPVDGISDPEADKVIVRDFPHLRDDLIKMTPDKSTPIILVKANVCSLLEPRLKADGFNVLNAGSTVYFPSTGQQNRFRQQFGLLLQSAVF